MKPFQTILFLSFLCFSCKKTEFVEQPSENPVFSVTMSGSPLGVGVTLSTGTGHIMQTSYKIKNDTTRIFEGKLNYSGCDYCYTQFKISFYNDKAGDKDPNGFLFSPKTIPFYGPEKDTFVNNIGKVFYNHRGSNCNWFVEGVPGEIFNFNFSSNVFNDDVPHVVTMQGGYDHNFFHYDYSKTLKSSSKPKTDMTASISDVGFMRTITLGFTGNEIPKVLWSNGDTTTTISYPINSLKDTIQVMAFTADSTRPTLAFYFKENYLSSGIFTTDYFASRNVVEFPHSLVPLEKERVAIEFWDNDSPPSNEFIKWSSSIQAQDSTSVFNIESSEPYLDNQRGEKTVVLKINFYGKFYNKYGESRFYSGSGTIGVAYPPD